MMLTVVPLNKKRAAVVIGHSGRASRVRAAHRVGTVGIRARDRCILIQRPMRSETVVIVSVGFQDPTQMRFATDNYVIETLAPDRSDQPFGKAVLPRRGWCSRLVPDAHGA